MLAQSLRRQTEKNERPIIAVSLVTAICLLADSMLYIALPIYYKDVGLESLWEVGLILALNRLIRLPINPFVGKLYQRIDLRTAFLIAIILTIITTVGYGVANGLWIWVLLRCLWGIAWSILRLGGYFTVIQYAGNERLGRLMGVYNGLSRTGSLVGMLIGGILVSIIGIKMVSLLFALCTVLAFPIVLIFLQKSRANKSERQISKKLAILRGPIWKVMVTGFLLAFFIQGVFTATLSYVIGVHYSEEIDLFGMVIAATALTGFIQAARWMWEPFLAVLFGQVSDGKRGRLPIFLLFLLISGAGFCFIPVQLPIFVWMVNVFIVMIAFTGITTVLDAITSDIAKSSNVNQVMTTYTVAVDFGAALGPFISFAIIGLEKGLLYTFLGGGFTFFCLFLYWIRIYRKEHE